MQSTRVISLGFRNRFSQKTGRAESEVYRVMKGSRAGELK